MTGHKIIELSLKGIWRAMDEIQDPFKAIGEVAAAIVLAARRPLTWLRIVACLRPRCRGLPRCAHCFPSTFGIC